MRPQNLLAIAIVAGCSSSAPPAVRPAAIARAALAPPAGPHTVDPAATPPALRLPATVRPLRSAVDLTIVPRREDFAGRITTELEISAEAPVVWLHANELVIDEASFVIGGTTIPAAAVGQSDGFVALRPAHPLHAGPARMTITYRGKMHRDTGDGIYTVEEHGEQYVFTQFEPTAARRAFPCFDEPSYKQPWQLTIHTDQALTALANTPVVSERDEHDGMKAVTFAETRPLPSYLVAFAVGAFEAVDAGTSRGGIPIRIVVPRGRSAEAAYPARVTRILLERLEDYFASPYPYSKLDLLAVPVFNLGAMENPGLITFHHHILLTPPARRSQETDKVFAYFAAHELAHQWFGDCVTLAWWDDTWLNESFATWLGAKIVDAWQPEWHLGAELVRNKNAAIAADSLATARAIRQPIVSAHDIANAFDGITYRKGGAVLTMLERWIGPDVFRAGVRSYLGQHAWGNAVYDDFLRALSAEAHEDMRELFDPFVIQSGVPLVQFELACRGGAAPTLKLSQRRYAPTGSQSDRDRRWRIPVCVRWGAGRETGRDCTLLDAPEGDLALGAASCPDWVLPNEDELGYYRVLLAGDLLDKLLAHARELRLQERVGVIGDVNALVASGDLPSKVALEMVERLAGDHSSYVVDASVEVIAGIDRVVPDEVRPAYERLIRKLYRARALGLGWRARPGDDDHARQLRSTLLWLVGWTGGDDELGRQASALITRWFGDRSAIDDDLVGIALHLAARRGDQKLYDRIHAEATRSTDRTERGRLLAALGAFADPRLAARAMAITLDDRFDLRETLTILQRGLGEPRTRAATYAFIKRHFDELAARTPPHLRPFLVSGFASLCDTSRRSELEAFLRPRIEKLDGGPRVLDQTLESLSLCSAARAAQRRDLIAFLRRQ